MAKTLFMNGEGSGGGENELIVTLGALERMGYVPGAMVEAMYANDTYHRIEGFLSKEGEGPGYIWTAKVTNSKGTTQRIIIYDSERNKFAKLMNMDNTNPSIIADMGYRPGIIIEETEAGVGRYTINPFSIPFRTSGSFWCTYGTCHNDNQVRSTVLFNGKKWAKIIGSDPKQQVSVQDALDRGYKEGVWVKSCSMPEPPEGEKAKSDYKIDGTPWRDTSGNIRVLGKQIYGVTCTIVLYSATTGTWAQKVIKEDNKSHINPEGGWPGQGIKGSGADWWFSESDYQYWEDGDAHRRLVKLGTLCQTNNDLIMAYDGVTNHVIGYINCEDIYPIGFHVGMRVCCPNTGRYYTIEDVHSLNQFISVRDLKGDVAEIYRGALRPITISEQHHFHTPGEPGGIVIVSSRDSFNDTTGSMLDPIFSDNNLKTEEDGRRNSGIEVPSKVATIRTGERPTGCPTSGSTSSSSIRVGLISHTSGITSQPERAGTSEGYLSSEGSENY